MIGVKKRREMESVKKLGRLTDARSDEMKMLFEDASMFSAKIEEGCEKLFQAYDILASNGRQSLSKINEVFNEELKIDFGFVNISMDQLVSF